MPASMMRSFISHLSASICAAITLQLALLNFRAVALNSLFLSQQQRPLLVKTAGFQTNQPASTVGVLVCQQDILLETGLIRCNDLAGKRGRKRANPLGALDGGRALSAPYGASYAFKANMHKLAALRLRGIGHAHCHTAIFVAAYPDIALDIVVAIRRKLAPAIDYRGHYFFPPRRRGVGAGSPRPCLPMRL